MHKLIAALVIALVVAHLGIGRLASGSTPAHADSPDADGNITIEASNSTFSPKTITVIAGQSLTVTFQNDDAGVSHNLAFDNPDISFDLCTDVCTKTLTFNAPSTPGSYRFICQVHAYLRMGGTLEVH